MTFTVPTFQYFLLDNRSRVFAASNDLTPLMRLMETRWAGTVVTSGGKVLFDIATDRDPSAAQSRRRANAEADLAWERAYSTASGADTAETP